MVQSSVQPGAVGGVDPSVAAAPISADAELAYEAGVELKARSQWSYARIRFFRHKAAVVSLVILILFALVAIFAKQLAPYGFDEIDLEHIDPVTGLAHAPTLAGHHFLGTDQLGRDYLSRIIYGIRTSLWVAVFVALLATAIGTAIGAVFGFYGGHVDNILMRITDLFFTVPGLALLLVAAVYLGTGDTDVSLGPITIPIYQPMKIGISSRFVLGRPRTRRARSLPVSAREGVRGGGEGRRRERPAHHHPAHPPELFGPIVVFTTLIVAGAILTEAFLSFVGSASSRRTPRSGS